MHEDVITMTRDCPTSRIRRDELLGLLDTMASSDRQMVTLRMEKLQVQDLNAVPESVELPEGTPSHAVDRSQDITSPFEDPWMATTQIRPLQRPAAQPDSIAAVAQQVPNIRSVSDLTLIGAICTFSMSICAVLAWLG
jgi:hypothetical protein